MRLHIHIQGALIAQVDEIAGPRMRSEFVRNAVKTAVAHSAFAVSVTGNPKDFPMEEVRVEHWPVGE